MNLRKVRSLRAWVLVLVPSAAIVLVSILRPTTLSIVGEYGLAWLLIASAFGFTALGPARWRVGTLIFGLVAASLLMSTPSLLGRGYEGQWDSLNGPGIDDPGPLRTHRTEEVGALVIVPWFALTIGAAAAFALRRVPPRTLIVGLLVLAFLVLLTLLLMPAVHAARE